MGDNTILALSSSDPHGLPGTGWKDDAMTMLRELAGHLEFDAGERWGESAAIDWDRTRYDANADAQLFVNAIGTDMWRPEVHSEQLSNLWFAGDFCRNKVGLTTIESAATAGVEVAAGIVARNRIGSAVTGEEPPSLPGAMYQWLRMAWAPTAAWAKTWSRKRRAGRSRRASARAAALTSYWRESARTCSTSVSSWFGSTANCRASSRAESAIRSSTASASPSWSR